MSLEVDFQTGEQMKIKDKNLKKMVDVNRAECSKLDCYNPCEWKGSITPGIGYSYAPKSQWCYTCLTRDNHGCPLEPKLKQENQ